MRTFLLAPALGLVAVSPVLAQGSPWDEVARAQNVFVSREPTLMNVVADEHRDLGADDPAGRTAFHRSPDRRWLAVDPGVRFDDHADSAAPPQLHLGATDAVTAGRATDLWFSTVGVSPDDALDVHVTIYRAGDSSKTAVLDLTSHLPAPASTWGRQAHIGLGSLPAGRYVARILFVSETYGYRAIATEKIVAR